MNVFKFGGASIKDANAIRNVASIIERFKDKNPVIVISASGKTTNALEAVLNAYFYKKANTEELLANIKQHHFKIIQDLFPDNHPVATDIHDTFVEIEWVLEEEPQDSYDYIYDQIVSVGEMLSTKIVAAYLNHTGNYTTWLDARDVISTDNTYRDAAVNWESTVEKANKVIPPLREKGFVITQGFIGGTSENFTTTLGREGSDYTAAILSYCLDAEDMSIWKDVPGVLSGDPRLFENAILLPLISYKEAIEMTYYGAKVIHPKTIRPLQNKQIPLYVKSFVNPDGKGTIIKSGVEDNYPSVIVVKDNQTLLHIFSTDFQFVNEEKLSRLFSSFAKHRIKVNMMQNTALNFSVCIDQNAERIENLIDELQGEYEFKQQNDLKLITVRHYDELAVDNLKFGNKVLLEERIRQTAQLVVTTKP